jgi:hypothetical protein
VAGIGQQSVTDGAKIDRFPQVLSFLSGVTYISFAAPLQDTPLWQVACLQGLVSNGGE